MNRVIVHDNQAEMKPLELGQIFKNTQSGDIYMLSANGEGRFILVNLKYGGCFCTPSSKLYGAFGERRHEFVRVKSDVTLTWMD